MSAADLHGEISDLSTQDKLELIEALWRSIAPEDLQAEPFDSDELGELEARAQRLRDNPTSGVPLTDLDDYLNRS